MQNIRLGIKICTATCNIFFQPRARFEWHEPYFCTSLFEGGGTVDGGESAAMRCASTGGGGG